MKSLLQNIKIALKDPKLDYKIIILILMILRIFVIKLETKTLEDLFNSMWSSILFIIDGMIVSDKFSEDQNCQIKVAALKLIELINYFELNEFNLHRWAFLFDFYDTKVLSELDDNLAEFYFKPLLTHLLPENTSIKYFDDSKKLLKFKKKIILTKNFIKKKDLEENMTDLLNFWTVMNQKKFEVDQNDIEEIIYGDFIDFSFFVVENDDPTS